MSLTRSSSPASPEAAPSTRHALQKNWPTLVVLPALVAIMGAAAASPLIAMFLGPDFGLSGGREAPWPWALALIGMVAFWSAAILDRSTLSRNASSAILVALGLGMIVLWWAIEPVWDVMPVVRNPISLVRGNGHLVLPLLIGLGVWVTGLRKAFSPGALGPEIIRENARNSFVVLAVSMALAGLIGGDMGGAGISASIVALPVILVCSAGAVAASEMDNTRRMAARRHTAAPGWDRWARVFGGTAIALLIVTGVGALFLGPGALDLMVDGMRGIWTVIATVILWVMYAVIYAVYYIYRFIAWIINSIFGDVLSPVEMPQMEGVAPPPEEETLLPNEPGGSEYATLLRWVALGIAILVVVIIIFMLARRRSVETDDGDVDEERSSIFSAALARKQLRDLFRRKPKADRPRRLDLARDPDSVRESMVYLQVLAARQDVPREPFETPRDFSNRLSAEWSGLEEPLRIIRDRYERVRYGETDEDHQAAIAAWREIWSSRKDVVQPAR
jgi:hypothetical protein